MQTDVLGEIHESIAFNDYTAVNQILFEFSEGIAFPSVAHFEGDSFDITYIGARHAVGRGIEHPTCQKILKEFERQKPDCVIVEGISENEFEKGQEWSNQYNDKTSGEGQLFIKLAIENDIPFFGGEPTEGEIQFQLMKQGYNELDIYVHNFIRDIHEKYKMGVKYDSIEQYLEKYSGSTEHYDNFVIWCKTVNYEPNLSKMLSSECSAPIKNGDFVQKLAYEIGKIRDTQILKILEKYSSESSEFKKILIVYGCSHYYQQYPILKEKFGTPKYEEESIFSRGMTHIGNIASYESVIEFV